VDKRFLDPVCAAGAQGKLSVMERVYLFDRNEIQKALASFQESGIESNRDLCGESIVWIIENAELIRATEILKQLDIRAVHKPWN